MLNVTTSPPQKHLAQGLFAAVLGGYFAFYLLAFSIPFHFRGTTCAAGDDFEYISTIKGSWIPRLDLIKDPGDIKKHPLFPLIATPLYRLGLIAFGKTPFREGLALAFPFALMGVLNLIISYGIFRDIFVRRALGLSAKWLTILYGGCFSYWIFAVNVETYMMTALFQNLFLWYCLRCEKERPNVWMLGFLFGLSLLASPAMIWLIFVIWVLLHDKCGCLEKTFLKSMAVVLVASCCAGAVYVFYDFYYHFLHLPADGGFGPKAMLSFSMDYVARWLRWDAQNAALLSRAFFIDSIVYTRLSGNLFLIALFWISTAWLFILSGLGLKKAKTEMPTIFRMFLGFELAYAVFFCFFSPESCILYALPALLPFLVILFLGVAFSVAPIPKTKIIICWILIVFVNNIGIYFSILKYKDFNLKVFQYAQVEKRPYDEILPLLGD